MFGVLIQLNGTNLPTLAEVEVFEMSAVVSDVDATMIVVRAWLWTAPVWL